MALEQSSKQNIMQPHGGWSPGCRMTRSTAELIPCKRWERREGDVGVFKLGLVVWASSPLPIGEGRNRPLFFILLCHFNSPLPVWFFFFFLFSFFFWCEISSPQIFRLNFQLYRVPLILNILEPVWLLLLEWLQIGLVGFYTSSIELSFGWITSFWISIDFRVFPLTWTFCRLNVESGPSLTSTFGKAVLGSFVLCSVICHLAEFPLSRYR